MKIIALTRSLRSLRSGEPVLAALGGVVDRQSRFDDRGLAALDSVGGCAPMALEPAEF